MGKIRMVSLPDKTGFLGYYPLDGRSEKNYEFFLENFPEEAYWCRIQRNHLNVYRKEVKLGEKTQKELKKIRGRRLILAVQAGAKTIQYEYKWE